MEVDEQSVQQSTETIQNDSSNRAENANIDKDITNGEATGSPIDIDRQDSIPRQTSITPLPQLPQPLVSETGSVSPSRKSKQDSNTSFSTSNNSDQPPMHEVVGGSSVRRYLNKHVTLTLMEGLKELARVQPDDPLRYLGEYLISKSNESKS